MSNAPQSRGPDFIVLGAGKCGTTSLCAYLRQHPRLFVADPKAIWYFCDDDLYGKAGWEWYREHFAEAAADQLIGEGTDRYSWRQWNPRTAERIAKDLPYARFIYIVRHPLEQIESLYMELVSSGEEQRDFAAALRENEYLPRVCRYAWQLAPYRDRYPEERFHICFYEDMVADLESFLPSLHAFLGVASSVELADPSPRNISAGHKHRDRPVTRVLRETPLGEWTDRQLQGPLRQALKPLLRRPIETRPSWTPALRNWVLEQIAGPSRQFLREHGKPEDFWDL